MTPGREGASNNKRRKNRHARRRGSPRGGVPALDYLRTARLSATEKHLRSVEPSPTSYNWRGVLASRKKKGKQLKSAVAAPQPATVITCHVMIVVELDCWADRKKVAAPLYIGRDRAARFFGITLPIDIVT